MDAKGGTHQALIAFLDADDYEYTLRLVISLGGDADTQAATVGSVAEAFWSGIPTDIQTEVDHILPLEMAKIITDFRSTFRRSL
jgi:ADP-ribosylglycohydrolase